MKACDFRLQPFAAVGPHPDLTITGSISRGPRILAIRYAVHGSLAELVIPGPAEVPARRHGLWEQTCFELFLAVKHAPRYWEFNLSPGGHWNVYRFADYREAMQEEPAIATLPFRFEARRDALDLTLECSLDRIIGIDQPLEVGISAVIQHMEGRTSFWALTHPGPHPDFHRRDSFIVELYL